MQLAAFFIATALLLIYSILSSIEFGASIYLLFPRYYPLSPHIHTYINPLWEATNVFLVFFLILLFSCFPKSIPPLSNALFPIIECGLIFFVVRVLGILGIFYAQSHEIKWRLLFFMGSIGAPLILSRFYNFALVGSTDISLSILTFAIPALTIASILMISSTFFLFLTNTPISTNTRFVTQHTGRHCSSL